MARSSLHSNTPPDRAATTTIHGPWLVLARVACLTTALAIMAAYIAGLVAYHDQLQQVCWAAQHQCEQALQLTPDVVQALQSLGLSLPAYAAYKTTLNALLLCGSWMVAAVIFWQRSNDWLALLVALMLVSLGDGMPLVALQLAHPASMPIIKYTEFVSSTSLILFYLFPNGRFVPRSTRWLALLWVVWPLAGAILGDLAANPETWPEWIFVTLWMTFLLSFVAAPVYRYRRVSDAVQRQQTKWIVWGVAVALIGFLTLVLVSEFGFPAMNQPGTLANLASDAILSLLFLLIPLSFGIAILRYRLFDIDVIINRTLVYATLTAALAAVYLGSVIVLQRLLTPLIGGNDQIVIVASTLAIAALFQPLRRRIQNTIDRRFYRQKYDAQRTLQAFAVRMRDETNVDQLTSDVIGVVEDTLHPAHVSLWLCSPERTASVGEQ